MHRRGNRSAFPFPDWMVKFENWAAEDTVVTGHERHGQKTGRRPGAAGAVSVLLNRSARLREAA